MSSVETAAGLTVMVVDDEPLARSNIAVLLRRDPQINRVEECGSGADALVQIRSAKPDLMFLDVQMPECDGFDLLEMLGSDLPPAVVFVTAYDQYALRAFEAGALDYLLKPFDNSRFDRALARAKERIVGNRNASPRDRIAIKSSGEVTFVKLSEIDWIEAADYYACLHVGAKSHLLRRSLTELEQELDPAGFCRIHRSAIVNLDRVQNLRMNAEGEYEANLTNGTPLPVSRRYRRQLKARLGVASAPSEESA
jgi:two-component system LytT family response regulator